MILSDTRWYKTRVREDWIKLGYEEQEKLKENRGAKTVRLFENTDVVGVVGREIFREYAEKNLYNCKIFDFVPQQYGDDCDLTIGNYAGDIKTKYIQKDKDFDFHLRSTNGTVLEHQIKKEIAFYVFCGWSHTRGNGYIFGWAPKAHFDRYAYHIEPGTPLGLKWKAWGSYELEVQRLFPIEDLSPENINYINKQLQ
ncbi:hypothetical protein IH981_04255 [Patescibacteria group bacterium]|nr:hypothetical protein [Patescibacteria group bacterium]